MTNKDEKYKIGDKVWKAEVYDSYEREIYEIKKLFGQTLYHIISGIGPLWCGESVLFDTREECEVHRLRLFGNYIETLFMNNAIRLLKRVYKDSFYDTACILNAEGNNDKETIIRYLNYVIKTCTDLIDKISKHGINGNIEV